LTKAQWMALMGTTPWSGWSGVSDDPDSPAEIVSWNDAHSFVTALNIHTGRTFRLPSEAEWEYACRAGSATRFYWGDDPSYTAIGAYAWYDGNTWDAGEVYAHVAGSKAAERMGLHDMSGNVLEWCEDDWHDNYAGAPADGSAWVDSIRGLDRVIRGGRWGSPRPGLPIRVPATSPPPVARVLRPRLPPRQGLIASEVRSLEGRHLARSRPNDCQV